MVFGLGFLFLIFLVPRLLPSHTDFVFAVSRRTFNLVVVTMFVGAVAALFFFARALRRRRLN